jgi:hypothetical protein
MREGRIVRQSDIDPAQRVVAKASLDNQVMLDLDSSAVVAKHRELHVSSALKLVGG